MGVGRALAFWGSHNAAGAAGRRIFGPSDAARDLVSRGIAGIETLIAGGDDYEILCTVAEDRVEAFTQAAQRAGVALHTIGMVVAGTRAPKFLDGQGGEITLKRRSYSHF